MESATGLLVRKDMPVSNRKIFVKYLRYWLQMLPSKPNWIFSDSTASIDSRPSLAMTRKGFPGNMRNSQKLKVATPNKVIAACPTRRTGYERSQPNRVRLTFLLAVVGVVCPLVVIEEFYASSRDRKVSVDQLATTPLFKNGQPLRLSSR